MLRLSSKISLTEREILMGSDMSYAFTITPRMAFLGDGGRDPYLFFLGANVLACFDFWYLQGLGKDLGDFLVLFVFMETLRFTLWKKVMVKGKRHNTSKYLLEDKQVHIFFQTWLTQLQDNSVNTILQKFGVSFYF